MYIYRKTRDDNRVAIKATQIAAVESRHGRITYGPNHGEFAYWFEVTLHSGQKIEIERRQDESLNEFMVPPGTLMMVSEQDFVIRRFEVD